jgi:hypothetical protein
MPNQVRTRPHTDRAGRDSHASRTAGARGGGIFSGGTEGNERLTVLTGLLLIVLLAALGITILRIGQLMWLHLFLGLLLIGPVALKMASTGYRFLRYYTANPPYQCKGPPAPILRLMAPVVVGLTVIVFISGVVLLFIGPQSSLRSDVFLIHKASFIGWVVVTALHIVGHLPEIFRLPGLAGDPRLREISQLSTSLTGADGDDPSLATADHDIAGRGARWVSLTTAVVLGLVLAIVLIPDFHTWTAGYAALHHGDH